MKVTYDILNIIYGIGVFGMFISPVSFIIMLVCILTGWIDFGCVNAFVAFVGAFFTLVMVRINDFMTEE